MRKVNVGREFFKAFLVLVVLFSFLIGMDRHDLSRYIAPPEMFGDHSVLWRIVVTVLVAILIASVTTLAVWVTRSDDEWAERFAEEFPEPSKASLIYGWSLVSVALLGVLLTVATLKPWILLFAALNGGWGAWWISDYYRDKAAYEANRDKREKRDNTV